MFWAIKFFNEAAVFLKLKPSVIKSSKEFLLIPNLSIALLKALNDFLLNPGKTILLFFTTSSVLNKNLENTSDNAVGFCIASDALVLFLDIFLSELSKSLAMSSDTTLIELFFPSSFWTPSNISWALLLLDLNGLPTNLSIHLSICESLNARSLPLVANNFAVLPVP